MGKPTGLRTGAPILMNRDRRSHRKSHLWNPEFKLPVAHKRLHLPNLASEVAVVLDATLQSAGLYNQKIHVLSEMNKNIACSVSKAETELGYSPKVSLEEGMRRSIAFCLERGMQI